MPKQRPRADARGNLDAYRSKRDPARTNEPFDAAAERGGGATLAGRFVVHLHHATRRHFDVRLEAGGVLMSFAVPRGPSLDPAEKRLAVRTEDHPLAYVDFEDVIPEGNYGAGAMIVWDAGAVRYLEGTAEDGVRRGKIDFVLSGHKLRGRFALVHTGARKEGGDERHWLFFKKEDAFARQGGDVGTDEPRSVLSGLTVEERASLPAFIGELEEEAARIGGRVHAVQARDVSPMLCALTGARLDDAERLYELKLDGVRALASSAGEHVELRSRNGLSVLGAFPELEAALSAVPASRAVLDGELVCFDDAGRPSFERVAARLKQVRAADASRAAVESPATYLVFDLLALGPYDLRAVPLALRKSLLARLVRGKGRLRYLEHVEGDGRAMMELCRSEKLEGLVSKRANSRYVAGPRRAGDWVKHKCQRDEDFVVVGWEEGARRGLGALVVASYGAEGELAMRGKVGSGFDERTLDGLAERLASLAAHEPQCKGELGKGARVHWVRPELVASVAFLGFTDAGRLRHPVFRGLRDDVAPRACTVEPKRAGNSAVSAIASDGAVSASAQGESASLAAPGAARVVVTNPKKVLFPGDGYNKSDLVEYYQAVAEPLLRFLRDRPLVVVRYPDGIEGESFYQWRAPKDAGRWLASVDLPLEGDPPRSEAGHSESRTGSRSGARKSSFVVDSREGLRYLANLACIPIHVLAARRTSLDACDFVTLDFDLGEQPLRSAVTLALTARELLVDLGLRGFPKTSGQTGLHVLVPVGPGVPFAAAKLLCELVGRLITEKHGDIATMERSIERRRGRVYVDTGQTGRSRTIVAPYSVRAAPGATVSTPLAWDEISAALAPARFTLRTVPDRIAQLGDPMAEFLELRPGIAAALTRLERWVDRSRPV